MKTMIKLGAGIALALGAQQALAFECVNKGAVAGVPPVDNGISSATACGPNAEVSATQSTALGFAASASGELSTAIGGAQVTADQGVAIGPLVTVSGASGTALGATAQANGPGSTALGASARADSASGTAVGNFAYADQPNTVILGAIDGVNFATESAKVGIGTTDPLAPLHVSQTDGAMVLVEDTGITSGPRTLFMLSSAGNTKFELVNSQNSESWAFTSNEANDFRISKQGSGVIEFQIFDTGDASLAGILTENSDRNAKTNIERVDSKSILDKVVELPISHWAYKETPDSYHIGPMAQDFYAAFKTGKSDTSLATLDMGGVAIASVQALNEKLEAQNSVLKGQNASLEERVALLEAMVSEMLPKTAQN